MTVTDTPAMLIGNGSMPADCAVFAGDSPDPYTAITMPGANASLAEAALLTPWIEIFEDAPTTNVTGTVMCCGRAADDWITT